MSSPTANIFELEECSCSGVVIIQDIGGIQIDVFPQVDEPPAFYLRSFGQDCKLEPYLSPFGQKLRVGDRIEFSCEEL